MAKRVFVKDLEAEIEWFKKERDCDAEAIKDTVNGLMELKADNTALIKKLEALEASLDVIAMAATAGLAVTEL